MIASRSRTKATLIRSRAAQLTAAQVRVA